MKGSNLGRISFLAVIPLLLAAVSLRADTFDRMISPVSNPVNFEDPRARTELRAIYAYHKIDDDFVTQGGNVRIYALQARVAVNDRLALIATKDGWVDFNPDAVLADESGFANISVGMKYAFHMDQSAGTILTAGLRYEIPAGNTDVFQGRGDGFLNPFLSGGLAMPGWNAMAGTGFRVPLDDADSTFYDLDVHLDVPVGNFYPSLEFNLVHVLNAGDRIALKDEGQDFFSFGSSEADGKTHVTSAVGSRYRFSEYLDWGAAYQYSMTNGSGSNITEWRITTGTSR